MSQIRQAQPADTESLKSLHRRCLRSHYAPILGSEQVATYIGSGEADAYIEDHLKRTMVLEHAFEPVGFCICVGPSIALLMVDPERWHKGFGGLLLDRAEEYLFSLYREIRFEGDARNSVANQFLRHHGWKVSKRFRERRTDRPMVRFSKTKP